MAAEPAKEVAPAPRESLSPRRGRILVVDDDVAVGSSLRRSLATEHDVTVLTSGKLALTQLVSGDRFDAILCDLMMPEMTGMDLHAELSTAMPEQADRMIFITGGAFTPAARTFLDRVPNQRMEKPFDVQNLRAAIRGFLR